MALLPFSSAPGSGSSSTWGSITGTLSSQTDLQTALDADLKGGHVYSVKKYGAVGDGSTDDTTAIQLAITTAQTAGGGTVFFPTGNYKISAMLTITADNIKLVGESQGSKLTLANSSNVTMIKASATTGTRLGFGMKDLYLDGNQANQTAGNGIEIVSCYNPLLENVWARYVYGYGLKLYGTGGQPYTAYGTFLNCQFTDGYGANAVGIYIDSTAEFNNFINCNADWHTGNQGKAIYINSGNNTFYGVQADMNGYNLYIASNVKNKFINCSFDRSTYREVWMTGGTQHNIFENCSFGYYNYLPLISTGITSGATVTSIALATALPQDIPTWGVPIIVGYGTANAETYTVTSAGASAGATSVTVNSQVATKTHATTEYAVLRYRGVDAQGGSGPNIFKGCAFQGSEALGQNNINWDKQVGEDGGCSGIYIGNIWNNGNGASLQPLSLYDYTNLAGTGLSTYSNKMGLGTNAPTARLHLGAGSATANTAPIKFTSGVNLTTPEDGAIEYNGVHYYATIGGTRYQLDQQTAASSGITRSVSVVSVNTSAGATASTDYVYLASGAITITLPTAVGNTNRYTIKKTDTGTTTTIATTSTQTIDGSTTATISVQYTSIELISDGTNWMVI